jgi:adenylate kinase
MNIILIGFPGSGKSTQAKKVSEHFNLSYLGTGDLVRTFLDNNLHDYKEQVSKGFLLPDNVVFKIVSDKINQFDLNIGFVMEGYPRTVVQAELLDCLLKEKKSSLDLVINLTIGSEIINSRVLNRHQCKYCGSIVNSNCILQLNSCPSCHKQDAFRVDDTKESLIKRLELFQSKSLPLLNYYKDKNILQDVNAGGTIDEVFNSILSILTKEQKKKEAVA